MSTLALAPVLFETRTLRIMFVADAPVVRMTAAASLMALVVRSALVSNLNVFAISA
jgi:hypothetical protein